LDVARPARIVRALLGRVLAHAQLRPTQAEVEIPPQPLLDPVFVPALRFGGRDEVLHLHLLELAYAELEVTRRDLVPKLLADLRNAERRLRAGKLRDVLEVDEDALRRLRAQIRDRRCILERADPRLEHEVELPCLGEVAVRRLTGMLRRPTAAAR